MLSASWPSHQASSEGGMGGPACTAEQPLLHPADFFGAAAHTQTSDGSGGGGQEAEELELYDFRSSSLPAAAELESTSW